MSVHYNMFVHIRRKSCAPTCSRYGYDRLNSICSVTRSAPPRMREVFSDYTLISRYIEVEVALARPRRAAE